MARPANCLHFARQGFMLWRELQSPQIRNTTHTLSNQGLSLLWPNDRQSGRGLGAIREDEEEGHTEGRPAVVWWRLPEPTPRQDQ